MSFLGANPYLDCIFRVDGEKLPPSRFVQEATTRHYCKDWDETDCIVIFTTRLSYEKNWCDNGHGDSCTGLECRLNEIGLKPKIHREEIPDGHSEVEIWQIFEKILNNLDAGDEVVFDITHAYRSIPMLAIVVLNYAKVLKDISISAICYGAFETLGQYHKVKEMPLKDRVAPILDLTAFDRLLGWSLAIDRFLGAGDAQAVSRLAKGSVAPVLRETKGQNSAALAVKKIADALDTYSKTLSTCRGKEIVASTSKLKATIKDGVDVDLVKPLIPLFEMVGSQINSYNEDVINDGIQAVRWCLRHNLIQQGYTLLKETLLTYVLKEANKDIHDVTGRQVASEALTITHWNKPEKKWHPTALRNRELTHALVKEIKGKKGLADLDVAVGRYRNDLNHAGYTRQPMDWRTFEKKLSDLLKQAESILLK